MPRRGLTRPLPLVNLDAFVASHVGGAPAFIERRCSGRKAATLDGWFAQQGRLLSRGGPMSESVTEERVGRVLVVVREVDRETILEEATLESDFPLRRALGPEVRVTANAC